MTYRDDLGSIPTDRQVRMILLLILKLRRWCPMNKLNFEKMIQKMWDESAKAKDKS